MTSFIDNEFDISIILKYFDYLVFIRTRKCSIGY